VYGPFILIISGKKSISGKKLYTSQSKKKDNLDGFKDWGQAIKKFLFKIQNYNVDDS